MTTLCRHSRVGIRFAACKADLLVAIAIAAAANLAVPTPAAAIPINYTLSGASANFPPVDQITGTFTFDTSGPTESNVSITVHNDPTFGTDTFTQATSTTAPTKKEIVASDPFNIKIFITFQNPLDDLNDPDPIKSVLDQRLNADTITDVTGSALDPDPTIPEPGSVALLSGALGLFLLTPRRNRRDGQTRPDPADGL